MNDTAYGIDARTFLFVPGTRPDRFAKAAASGADAVILDLEDAVSAPDKAGARRAAVHYVSAHPALVRINAAGTPWHGDDLAALRGGRQLAGIVLPKTESPEQIAAIVEAVGPDVGVFALLETARGIRDAAQIAQSPGIARLLFGDLDFRLDVGMAHREGDDLALLFARSAIVVAARAAGLPGPVDGVQPEIDNDPETLAAARRAAGLGFSGKLCLHPRQVPLVHTAFAPTALELRWARQVIEFAAGSTGAVRVGGEMIDKPRLEPAQRMVDAVLRDGVRERG
jgi:citrate lyase subunit beta/citryl-CoA lyase